MKNNEFKKEIKEIFFIRPHVEDSTANELIINNVKWLLTAMDRKNTEEVEKEILKQKVDTLEKKNANLVLFSILSLCVMAGLIGIIAIYPFNK